MLGLFRNKDRIAMVAYPPAPSFHNRLIQENIAAMERPFGGAE
jgi:hypothetical protein